MKGQERKSVNAEAIKARIVSRDLKCAVVGMGYVGLPLAVQIARAGFATVGIDVDRVKVERLADGESPIEDVSETIFCSSSGRGAWASPTISRQFLTATSSHCAFPLRSIGSASPICLAL